MPGSGETVCVWPELEPSSQDHRSPHWRAHLQQTRREPKPSPPTSSPKMCTSGSGRGPAAADDDAAVDGDEDADAEDARALAK